MDLSPKIKKIFKTNQIELGPDELIKVTGGISQLEAEYLSELVEKEKLLNILEIGVAHGISTLSLCDTLQNITNHNSGSCGVVGIDPCQSSGHNNLCLKSLKVANLSSFFTLIEKPSHLGLPPLVEENRLFDFVFIDGWHTFDYTLIDIFLSDKLLKPGGYLAMHDYFMPSKRKAWGYLLSHRNYQKVVGPGVKPLLRFLSIGKQTLIGNFGIALSKIFFRSNLVVAKKIDNFEPNYDFFKNF